MEDDEGAEVVLPFPAEPRLIQPTTQVRSTLIMSSLQMLRDEGLYGEYQRHLQGEYRELVLGVTSPCWLPIEAAMAHYGACNDLALPSTRVADLGRRASMKSHGTFLGVALNIARGVGVTPWTVMGQTRRIWERGFVGGGIAVFKLGPYDARLEIVAWPPARIEYCRHAFRGLAHGVCLLLSKMATVREVAPSVPVGDGVAYRINWS
ncbi:MAG TPA: hypothetical protein VI072_14925 [Polyangiaceae bacterium]